MDLIFAEETACDLCNCPDHDLLFVKEGFRHVRCRSCGLVFVNPILKDHFESQTRTGTGSMGDEELTSRQVRRLRRELAGIEGFRKTNRMLEIGAGRGWFPAEAMKNGWDAWVVEINADALECIRSKGITNILIQSAEELSIQPESVDVVRMWDVIEHLRSPRAAMEAVFKALRPGGLLVLSTTNFASLSCKVNGPEWVYLNGADHIVLFDPATITMLLKKTGFSSPSIRTRSFNLRRKLYHPEKILPPKRSILSPFRKIIDESMRFTMMGHQMIVHAVKPENR